MRVDTLPLLICSTPSASREIRDFTFSVPTSANQPNDGVDIEATCANAPLSPLTPTVGVGQTLIEAGHIERVTASYVVGAGGSGTSNAVNNVIIRHVNQANGANSTQALISNSSAGTGNVLLEGFTCGGQTGGTLLYDEITGNNVTCNGGGGAGSTVPENMGFYFLGDVAASGLRTVLSSFSAITHQLNYLGIGTTLDLHAGTQAVEIPNCAVSCGHGGTGTTLNKIAVLTTASPSTVTLANYTDTSGAIGVVVGNPGTSGNAQIAVQGQASCLFDGPTTAGHYVQMSTGSGTPGECHDAGASSPASVQVLGRVLSTNGTGGTYSMALSGGGSGASGTVSPNNGVANEVAIYIAAGGSTTVSADSTLIDNGTTLTYGGSQATINGNNVQQALCSTPAQSAITGNSAAQNVYTCTIPAALFTVGHSFRGFISLKHTAGTATITYAWKLGGTSFTSYTAQNTTTQVQNIFCIVTGTNQEQCSTDFALAGSLWVAVPLGLVLRQRQRAAPRA
jgi:hypothetical protein